MPMHTEPLWGTYGRVLLVMGRQVQCVEWLSDWRDRKDAAAWMLMNLVIALRHVDEWDEARGVGLSTDTIAPPEQAHRVSAWLAVDDALSRNTSELDIRPTPPLSSCFGQGSSRQSASAS